MKNKKISGLILIAFFPCVFISAQEGKEQSELSQSMDRTTPVVLSRINGLVTLDGMSDEPCWQNVTPFPLTMHRPTFGKEPTERSEVFVAYDDNYLYAAGRFYDSEPE